MCDCVSHSLSQVRGPISAISAERQPRAADVDSLWSGHGREREAAAAAAAAVVVVVVVVVGLVSLVARTPSG